MQEGGSGADSVTRPRAHGQEPQLGPHAVHIALALATVAPAAARAAERVARLLLHTVPRLNVGGAPPRREPGARHARAQRSRIKRRIAAYLRAGMGIDEARDVVRAENDAMAASGLEP